MKGLKGMKLTESLQIKMLKNRNDILAKEVENLKAKNKLLEIQLSAYKDVDPSETAKKFAELERLKNEYMQLNTDLRKKLNEANDYLKQGKELVNKEGAKFEKSIDKSIKNITNRIDK